MKKLGEGLGIVIVELTTNEWKSLERLEQSTRHYRGVAGRGESGYYQHVPFDGPFAAIADWADLASVADRVHRMANKMDALLEWGPDDSTEDGSDE